jgi:ribA/ribD-fused uncharacterized protein
MNNGLDTDTQVFFYEQDFYVLSNFSAFSLRWKDHRFDTSEAAYQWEKFPLHADLTKQELVTRESIRNAILNAPSAHDAYKIAERNRDYRRKDWDSVKVDIMRNILRSKAHQHEYVNRKLLDTGDRELIENSWRDSFWGWGPDKNGLNTLGKLWMEVRSEIRSEVGSRVSP